MLAIMLEKSLCRTFRSPNQRISQGWEGKKPALAGFLLAVVLVCYTQDKINKSYQLDTTMKINEIAPSRLDEINPLNIPGVKPVVKYVGPYFDKAAQAAAKLYGAGKGTSQAELDALRAGETGAAKSGAAAADRQLSTVSKDELNALLYPPAETNPTVASWIKNRQSDAGPAVWRRRGDPGFDPDLSKNKALPPGFRDLPPADVGATIRAINNTPRPSASGPKPRPRPADLDPTYPNGPRPRNAEPELGNMEPPLQAGPAAAEIGQVRPGVDAKASAAGSTAAGAQRYTMDEIRQFQELLRTNPAAAQEQAKKMGFLGKAGLTTLGAATLGLGVQGAHMVYPDTIPSVGKMASKAAGAVSDFVAPIGVNSKGSGPPAGDKPYDPKDFAPSADQGQDDPLRKEKDEALRQALSGEIKESTAALNRMVYLSRL
jgi:hypothetical protein